ncbi:MAG: hypothetical protein IPP40_13780 [bacterium]|nr:hypothetical protein [bacterium]
MKPPIGILQQVLQLACLVFATLVARADRAALPAVPEPIGYVSDYARVVDPSDERS